MNNQELQQLWDKFETKNVSRQEFFKRMKAATAPPTQQEMMDLELRKARQRTSKGLIDRAIRRQA